MTMTQDPGTATTGGHAQRCLLNLGRSGRGRARFGDRSPQRGGAAVAALCLGALLAGCNSGGRGGTNGSTASPTPGGGGGNGACGLNDPAFYQTPNVVGAGMRLVTVTPGQAPTLAQSFADARAGDIIELTAGVHSVSGGSLRLVNSGTAANWIVIRAAVGATPTIDLQSSGELNIAASFVAFENLEIVNGGGNNLHIAPINAGISNVIVRGCRIRALASGPGAAIKINRNNAQNAGVELIYLENNDLSESISNAVIDGVGVRMAVARGNDIHDNAVGSHGIFFKGGSSDILIEKNLIRGIRQNAALQLGGITGAGLFDPLHPDREGVDQLARNNLIVDCDDSIFEVRGVLRGQVIHNTVVSQTGFAIFRLSAGRDNTGGQSDNDDLEFSNNCIVATGGNPQYARNDGNAGTFLFGPQLFAGDLRNSSSGNAAIPTFPQAGDVVIAPGSASTVLLDPTFAGLSGLSDALARYRLVAASPAIGQGAAARASSCDIVDVSRSTTAPSLGAYELP